MILPFRKSEKSFALFVFLHLFFLCSFISAIDPSDTITITASESIGVSGGRNNPLNSLRKVQPSSLSARKSKINQILDSLGYLNRTWVEEEQILKLIPGKRFKIVEISIDATPLVIDQVSFPVLPIDFDAGEINRMISSINLVMAQNGYPFATVITSISKSENSTVRVYFAIEEDQFTGFSYPLISGDIKTKELFLYDISFERGDIFDIRKVEKAAVRLRSRPYVSSVEVLPPFIAYDDHNADDSMLLAVVPFSVEERSGMSLEGALGFQSGAAEKGINGKFNLSMINVFHRGEEALLEYFGDKNWQRLLAEIKMPWLFGASLTGGMQLGIEIEEYGYGHTWGHLTFDSEVSEDMILGTVLKVSETVPPDTGVSWNFYGADLILKMIPPFYERGVFGKEFSIRTGSGFARRKRTYSRTSMELSGGMHIPFLKNHGIFFRLFSKNIFTDEDDLAPAELFRVGGNKSARGYSENEFVFRSVLYGQAEYLLYINPRAPVYIFLDAGSGFTESGIFDSNQRVDFLGYGLGLRFPSKIGTASIEWARSIQDNNRSWGRVHIGVKNRF